jgi:hypothetical protein
VDTTSPLEQAKLAEAGAEVEAAEAVRRASPTKERVPDATTAHVAVRRASRTQATPSKSVACLAKRFIGDKAKEQAAAIPVKTQARRRSATKLTQATVFEAKAQEDVAAQTRERAAPPSPRRKVDESRIAFLKADARAEDTKPPTPLAEAPKRSVLNRVALFEQFAKKETAPPPTAKAGSEAMPGKAPRVSVSASRQRFLDSTQSAAPVKKTNIDLPPKSQWAAETLVTQPTPVKKTTIDLPPKSQWAAETMVAKPTPVKKTAIDLPPKSQWAAETLVAKPMPIQRTSIDLPPKSQWAAETLVAKPMPVQRTSIDLPPKSQWAAETLVAKPRPVKKTAIDLPPKSQWASETLATETERKSKRLSRSLSGSTDEEDTRAVSKQVSATGLAEREPVPEEGQVEARTLEEERATAELKALDASRVKKPSLDRELRTDSPYAALEAAALGMLAEFAMSDDEEEEEEEEDCDVATENNDFYSNLDEAAMAICSASAENETADGQKEDEDDDAEEQEEEETEEDLDEADAHGIAYCDEKPEAMAEEAADGQEDDHDDNEEQEQEETEEELDEADAHCIPYNAGKPEAMADEAGDDDLSEEEVEDEDLTAAVDLADKPKRLSRRMSSLLNLADAFDIDIETMTLSQTAQDLAKAEEGQSDVQIENAAVVAEPPLLSKHKLRRLSSFLSCSALFENDLNNMPDTLAL